MKPNALEALRGVQANLLGVIAPELQTAFAQDSAQAIQMLLESIAEEWDTAAETLSRDNQRLSELLAGAATALRSLPPSEPELGALSEKISGVLGEPPEESLAVSRLRARNERLRSLLERTIVVCEETAGRAGFEPLTPVRESTYRHLREVAARGWSFWDMASFRERMTRLRAGGG